MDWEDNDTDAWYEFIEFISGTDVGRERTIKCKNGEVYKIRREK